MQNKIIKNIIKEEYRDFNINKLYDSYRSRYENEPNYKEIVSKNVKEGSTLVIHPDDRTTDFLDPSYADLSATVLTNQKQMFNLRETMRRHDRIIMMGHGTPFGLLMPKITIYGVDLLDEVTLRRYRDYVLGSSYVDILKTKPIVAVWCNADQFILQHDLHGFYTGMVISELCEANYCNVNKCDQKDLNESNELFTLALKEAIKIQSPQSVNVFKEIYNNPKNSIMVYNRQRIYYR